jgi:hypothetical protein
MYSCGDLEELQLPQPIELYSVFLPDINSAADLSVARDLFPAAQITLYYHPHSSGRLC